MLAYKCTTRHPVRTGKVQFGILSDEDTRRMSVCQVKDTTIYYRGLPNPHGINDHRMGTVDRRLMCGTCCRGVKECQGHVGHLELSYPMYHIGFMDICLKTLRSVCFMCSRLLLSDDDAATVCRDEEGKNRFNIVYVTARTKKKCPHCAAAQPLYTRTSLGIKCDWPNDTEWESEEEKLFGTATFTQRDAYSILTHITKDDATVLGFNEYCRPCDFMSTSILVPPPVARPAIMASEGSRSRGQDDLTHKLQDITKRSNELQNAIGNDSTWRDALITCELIEKINRLQFEVFTYVNNNIRGQKQSTQRSGAPTKSITDRLRGKDGRIRGNLMGKRVDFSARSVITPDAVMDVDEVGIPYKIAMSLTIPVVVTSSNIEDLTTRVTNGTTCMHGAETVITSSGIMINLTHCDNRERIRLQFGWIVERFLCDGDIVIFNRQPSLHKMGMMGHRVRLMSGNTFRLNLCCANPYNADFDGDEMNLHVPQSPAAEADIATIMMVSRQIISPQANRPVMGIVQDTLLGAFLMSHDEHFFDYTHACHIYAHIRYPLKPFPSPCVLYPCRRWSGKQLLSILFPKNFMYGIHDPPENLEMQSTRVIIFRGVFVAGILKKVTLGASAGGIIDSMYRMHGGTITIRWMSDIQRMVNAWLCFRGFNVSVRDCLLSAESEQRVQENLIESKNIAEELLLENVEDGTEEAFVLESTVVRILSKCLVHTGGVVDKELGKNNAIQMMVKAGSKGNPINLSQICGCVGQQSVEGKRVFSNKDRRTLPCFSKGSKSIESNGFVQNSYALGLHPHEYFFHAMGGREGLVDTAVKTATTGYIQRRQMKAMEDHKVAYDHTIRNASDFIVDFSYGGDGFDPTRVERIAIKFLVEKDDFVESRLRVWEYEHARICRRELMRCKVNAMDERILLPFNPTRELHNIKFNARLPHDGSLGSVESMVRDAVEKATTFSIRAGIVDTLNTNELTRQRFTNSMASELFKNINGLIVRAKVNCGEMVGSIAAQSIGEPCTQMTLNSVDWNTCMVIHWTGDVPPPVPCDQEVGAFIDGMIEARASDCIAFGHDSCTTYLPLDAGEAVALSPNEDGVLMWTPLLALTRHPPQNDDGTGNLVRIKTASGREVRVTRAKSVLVKRVDKLVEIGGDEIKVGDLVPIAGAVSGLSSEEVLHTRRVLPESLQANSPDEIVLDYPFGCLYGAYLSTGVVCDDGNIRFEVNHAVAVIICEWCATFGVVTRFNDEFHLLTVEGGAFVTELLTRSCGRMRKRIPSFAFVAPDTFVRGVLNAYRPAFFSRSSNHVHMKCDNVVLRDGVSMLFARMDVRTTLDSNDGAECDVHVHMYSRAADEDIMRDVVLDRVVEVTCVPSSADYVYDLTVETTKNMTCLNGLAVRDTFHLSGVGNKSVTLGIPRLKELLDHSKTIKTPINRIRFRSPFNKSEDFASYFASTLPLTRLSDIVTRCDIVLDEDTRTSVIESDVFMVEMHNCLNGSVPEGASRYVVRLVLNQCIMKSRRISPPQLRKILRNRLRSTAHIVSSETNSVEWIIRIRFLRMMEMLKPLDDSAYYEGLICHRTISVMMNTIAISGHIQISGAHHTATSTSVGCEEEYVVETQGCCLIDLSAASCVDWYNSTSNDINEVHNVLGLEATVCVLFQELHTTISFDGTYVDPRHIMMICNTMTRGGYIMPLSRHGINRMDTGPLLRCSFEETPDILCDAACFGEHDNGHGVSQNIMTGKLPEIGSGMVSISVSPSMMHPRETMEIRDLNKNCISKSTVRNRSAGVVPLEVHQRRLQTNTMCTNSSSIEAPFISHDDVTQTKSRVTDIFSSETCQLPYNESEPLDVCMYENYTYNDSCDNFYKPSTPEYDD